MKFVSKSSSATKKFSAQLAKKILKSPLHRKHARVLALVGDLGAGKTTFTQGFAKALGIKHRIVSPTFLIFRSYKISSSLRPRQRGKQSYNFFYHVDVYRIHADKELKVLNFKSILHSPLNIVLIEWADKIKKILPKDTVWIKFEHQERENERKLTINK